MCECGGFSVNDDGGGQVVFESPQVESEAVVEVEGRGEATGGTKRDAKT